ncbi:MAG TPA: MFS transporter [Polyangiaceae bacterium]|nr:MFS transporter [Polyangiaceae bacterium]
MSEPAGEGERPAPPPLSTYQKRLLVFLSVATFFEGYDFIALAQILPNFRADMHVGPEVAGRLVALINFGSMLAYALVRRADQWGRRRVLTVTITGYTISTFVSGLAPGPWSFAFCQMLARIFLIGEYATSMVIAAEEFPKERRGLAIGTVAAFSSFGAILCAGLVPFLVRSPYGWRTVYFVALLPLVTIAYARRGLHETKRFEEQGAHRAESVFHVFRTPYRKRVLELGVVWIFAYVSTQNTVTFWKDFAMNERGLTDKQVAASVALAAVVALPLVFGVGKALDSWGRRPAAAVVFAVGGVGTIGCYTLTSQAGLTVSLVAGIFASSAFLPILNSFTTELFPTAMRADGFAWANNLIGRLGYVLSPIAVGALAETMGYGPVLRLTAIFPFIGIGLIYVLFPETKGRSLEETAAL